MQKVSVTSLNFGGGEVQMADLPAAAQRKFHAILNSREVTSFLTAREATNFSFEFHDEALSIDVGRAKKTIRIAEEHLDSVRYWERLSRGFAPAHLARRGELAKAGKEQMEKEGGASPEYQSWYRPVLPAGNALDEALSLGRNIASLAPEVGPDNALVGHLGIISGIFWMIFSHAQMKAGPKEIERGEKVGDEEGVRRGKMRLYSGMIVSGASSLYTTQKVSNFIGVSLPAAGFFAVLASTLFMAGSTIAIAASSLNLYRCWTFRNRLDEYLENEELSQELRRQGAVQLILDQAVNLTSSEELQAIQKAKEAWEKGGGNLEKLKTEALEKAVEVKLKKFRRRTGQASVNKVLEFLKKGGKGISIQDQEDLIQTVLRENTIKKILFTLGVIGGILGLLATLIGTIFSFGTFPLVLAVISGVIYLSLAIYALCCQRLGKSKDGDQGTVGISPVDHHS